MIQFGILVEVSTLGGMHDPVWEIEGMQLVKTLGFVAEGWDQVTTSIGMNEKQHQYPEWSLFSSL
jgi:hypothetical protein